MAFIGDFIKSLAAKGGMDVTNEQLATFLSNEQLNSIEVPEEVIRGIDNSLISLKDAKNNHPEIKNFYQKQALDTVDNGILQLLDDFGVDEAVRGEILGERSTYKRIPLLVKKIRDLEAKKVDATTKTDKTALQKQIDELQNQLRLRTQQEEALRNNYEQKVKAFKRQYRVDQLLSQYKTIYDDPRAPLDPEVKSITLRNLLEKSLAENNAELDFDENDNFVLVRKEGGNYYGDDNKQVTPQQFAESMLSRNKILSVTQAGGQAGAGATQQRQQQQQQQQRQQPAGGQAGAGGKTTNSSLSALVQESIKSLEQSNSVPIL